MSCCLAGDDSEGEVDGQTHRAGSKGGSVDELDGVNMLHRHIREKAEVGTPTKLMWMDKEGQGRRRPYDSSDEEEKGKGKEKPVDWEEERPLSCKWTTGCLAWWYR